MGFLSLVVALLLEQVRPLQNDNVAYGAVRGLARSLERNFNAGESQHGFIAWLILAVPLTALSWIVFVLLARAHLFLGLGWDVIVLYLTLGFRQFSHYFTDIQVALANNDLPLARKLLSEWRGSHASGQAGELTAQDVARVTIEEALIASHRHVFGVFFWFVVLPGPSGAVLYRLTDYLARKWNPAGPLGDEPFGNFARRAFRVLDWAPVRMTAIGFAIVGNFEDAVFCWRNYASQWRDRTRGIILASGAGAIGVRLGDSETLERSVAPDPDNATEAMPGVEAGQPAMRSAVGLVWRSLVLWMVLLLLLSVAGLIG